MACKYDFGVVGRSPVVPGACGTRAWAWAWSRSRSRSGWHWPPQLLGVSDSGFPGVSWGRAVPSVVWAVLRESTDINPNKPKAEEEESIDILLLPENRRKNTQP